MVELENFIIESLNMIELKSQVIVSISTVSALLIDLDIHGLVSRTKVLIDLRDLDAGMVR